ncbi:sugar phosphate isomerase/epimerase family protein [Ammoniphilus sp. YIM 78166]|uniref:sugar phosphate isomerase/epimerase family protein n=1 Tax=Ammoniphilus sp. YIM 78166 TaxID=1644106 RepID=UPI00106FBA33|nr:sugar phosphate isomerase/epimerase family protein [Ammoniphilus sp. YIM 78166]
MKLAYPYGTPELKSQVLGATGDAQLIFPRLREMGYTAIEPFIRDLRAFDTGAFIKSTHLFDLRLAAIGTGPMVSDDQLTFTSKDPGRRAEAIQRMKELVQFASQFGCPVGVGKLRGAIHPEQPEQSWNWMKEAFEQVCRFAEGYGVQIALEPQNKQVINNLTTTQEALVLSKS